MGGLQIFSTMLLANFATHVDAQTFDGSGMSPDGGSGLSQNSGFEDSPSLPESSDFGTTDPLATLNDQNPLAVYPSILAAPNLNDYADPQAFYSAQINAISSTLGFQSRLDNSLLELQVYADQLVIDGRWADSNFQKRYGLILNNIDPTRYTVSLESLEQQKAKIANLGYGDDLDPLKHTVGDPTRIDVADYVSTTRANSANPNYGSFQRSVVDGKYSTKLTHGISGVGILIGGRSASQNSDGSWSLKLEDFLVQTDSGKILKVCENSLFGGFDDESALHDGYCSGFLSEIDGKQVFVTAEHCANLGGAMSWEKSYVAFGFARTDDANEKLVTPQILPEKSLYRIVGILDRAQWPPENLKKIDDFVVFTLETDVATEIAVPLEIDVSDTVSLDDLVALVGYPNGLAQKIDQSVYEPSIVGKLDDGLLLKVSTDSSHGDSGAPVISVDSGKVVGMLIAGSSDYHHEEYPENSGQYCAVSNVTEEVGKSMEIALGMKRLRHLLPD